MTINKRAVTVYLDQVQIDRIDFIRDNDPVFKKLSRNALVRHLIAFALQHELRGGKVFFVALDRSYPVKGTKK